ncbi:HAD-IIIA family hydrolase [uncultured Prochlorococcus sp.]|uniref:HAD-IIIA family hydrolase n=1 Tax=uncultured Prochlorococcus sp. TaxID=159733 RepID=UPI00258F365D|nr:HAD-IIIA family hydrolase [uncultured Prochlorococcus sp.]
MSEIINLDKFYFEEFSRSISKFTLKSKKKLFKKALFLDRDGVLIEDVHHINSPEKVKLCPKVLDFLKDARKKNYGLIVVTNQSSVSRSIISYQEYKAITSKFLSLLTEDIYPEFILSSFHLPKNTNNLENYNWRKPGTGMIDYVLNISKFNTSQSYIIGDKLTDLIAGYRSGLSNFIYVKSKLHSNQSNLIKNWSIKESIPYKELIELDSSFI